ncbi:MAG: cation-translocating P-type ATPase [Deltaproteobacteria bacterium]|nr:cation-translocating P-type ATPase [Deltaproteobacteria bacterium]
MKKSTPQAVEAAIQTETIHWHVLSPQDVLERLNASEEGLSSKQAAERLAQYGLNQLTEAPRPSFLSMLWGQFNNFIVKLLIAASIVSSLLGEWIDASAIMAIVLLNAILGIIQDRRAENALAALKKLAAPEAHVRRDGYRIAIPTGSLVPGDIVYLEAGNHIPADMRLLEAINLQVDEASLTGESLPVLKNASLKLDGNIPLGDRKNTAFMGSTVTSGRGHGVITSTGMRTQLGLIAGMLQQVGEEETPLQRRLDQLGKVLGWGAMAVCGLVFIVSVLKNTDLSLLTAADGGVLPYLKAAKGQLVDMFLVAVSLAIAAVPEGLPAVVTISLALGMHEMIHRHALIRRLSSVETLGSATIICSDKTGTLTQNEMTVTHLWVDGQFVTVTGSGYSRHGEIMVDNKPCDMKDYPAVLTTLWVGGLNNDAQLEPLTADDQSYRIIGDPTEGALLIAVAKADKYHGELHKAYPRTHEVPFDSGRKRMVTIHDIAAPRPEDLSPFYDEKQRGWVVIAVKGAPDVVLNLCSHYQSITDTSQPLDEVTRRRILDANDAMTQDALRVLGVAYRVIREAPKADAAPDELEKNLIFVGLVGMIDPAREEVKGALEKAMHAGIRTMMITGDYPNTARAIAKEIGLLRPGNKVLTGADLDRMSDDDLKREIKQTDVFARVSPEHKMRIVDALHRNGEVVAMTGDGVNDAPAIKRADIGVAMGITGTDVTKETADMVLTDDNYVSIVSAVEQGRIIYDNIRKFVFYLLSSNVAEIMIIFLTTLAGLPTPLTAIQLLWLNLITDGAPALALAMEKGDPDSMLRKPRPKREPIINTTMQLGIFIQTIMQTGATLSAFGIGLTWGIQALGHSVPQGTNPLMYLLNFDWRSIEPEALLTARTMAFATLSLAELFRAYTVRSERVSLFRLGVFSNRFMQYAVGLSITLLLIVCALPFLQPVFNTHSLGVREWGVVVGLALIPAVTEEITKLYLRYQSRGHRIVMAHT